MSRSSIISVMVFQLKLQLKLLVLTFFSYSFQILKTTTYYAVVVFFLLLTETHFLVRVTVTVNCINTIAQPLGDS